MSVVAQNRKKAIEIVTDSSLVKAQNLVAGKWRAGKGKFMTFSPHDNSAICDVTDSGKADVDAACEAAAKAFPAWRDLSSAKRQKVLYAIADAILEKAEEIALVESLDTGQPLRFMRKAALRGAENFRFFAERAPLVKDGLSLPTNTHMNYTVRSPIGPVGVITPWNTPFMLSTWKIAPALASGCTVVHKPAEWSPLSACILAKILNDHLPSGVFNMVHGTGEVAGVRLTEHEAIKAIAFVGESVTGSKIMAQGAPTLKRCHFELGGKNPVVIFDDANIDRAVDAAVFMIYSLNGERCTSSSRVLAQKGIKDKIVKKIAARAKSINVGDPMDPDTELGPLIHPEHLKKVSGYFQIAKKEKAKISAGGKKIPSKGNYVEPTLFSSVKPNMRVAREEIFGPVLSVIAFDDEAEAIKLANDTDYGLTAYIWTNDGSKALRVAHGIDAGMVWVNSENVRHLPSPFGGMKSSGIGRDGGDYSFEFFTEEKNVCLALGEHSITQLGKGKGKKRAAKK